MGRLELRPYQRSAIQALRLGLAGGHLRQMLYSPTGCHARGERVLLSSGESIAAEDVRVGDALIGDDGGCRTVFRLHRGRQEMARITPTKGDSFVVNIDHVLSLVHTETGNVVDLTVREWLGRSAYFKHCHKLFRVPVHEFSGEKSELPIHPWLLGVLLGDGSLGGNLCVTNPEKKIQEAVVSLAVAHGVDADVRKYGERCESVHITNACGVGNPLRASLKDLGLIGLTASKKHVPGIYRTSNFESRLLLLAGLMDTDGHESSGYYDWISASKQLAEDVAFIARSVGMAAYVSECVKRCQTGASGTYYRVSLSGDMSILPTVKRRSNQRRQKKSVLRTGFSVELIGEGDYFGWEVDGNHRYLMSDFTVTHNSGKTEVAMAVIQGAIDKGKRVVFLCNRIHLVGQASKRFYRSGIEHGVIQGNNTRNIDARVIVGSIQTVAKRGMPDCDLIVIDEAHAVAGSKDFRSVIIERNAVPVIGLSATPFSKGLGKHYAELGGALFEAMTVATSIADLIGDGFLVDCDIYAPSEPDMAGIKTSRNAFGELDWSDADVGRAVDKPQLIGDIVSHWMRLSRDLPTVCFAANIAHSKHIVESFRASGVSAEHIDCYTTEEERAAILGRVESGETTVISNVGILTEGWDFPACRTMILARPTRSLIRYIQMIGRVLRPHHTKDRALVLDHSGTVQRLGFPTDDLPLDLDDGRPRSEQKEGKEALPKKCPECHYMKPPKVSVCPKCGFKTSRQNDVQEADGELLLMTRKRKATMADKQKVFSELLAIKSSRGYSDGWVSHKFKAYFGCWPKGLMRAEIEPSPEIKSWVLSQQIRFAKARESRHAA